MTSCLICPYQCSKAGGASRPVGPEKETTPQPKDTSEYSLSRNASGAMVCCQTTVVIANRKVDAIIDTGAARTMLSAAWYEGVAEHLPPLQPCSANLRGAAGEVCDVQGQVELQLFLEGVPYFHPVVVSIMPCVEMLIGIDFLYRHGAIIDCQFGRLIIKHQNITIRSYRLNTPLSVRVKENREIGPESEILLECYVNPGCRFQDGMFDVCTVLGEGITVLPGLVTCDEKGLLRLPVKNHGMYTHQIAEHQTIGTFTLFDEVEVAEVYAAGDSKSVSSLFEGDMVGEGLVWSKLPCLDSPRGDYASKSDSAVGKDVGSVGRHTYRGVNGTEACIPVASVVPVVRFNVPGVPASGGCMDLFLGTAEEERAFQSECPDHLKLTLAEADLSPNQFQEEVDLIIKYQDVFVGPDGKVGYTDLVKHRIDTGKVAPVKQPVRRMGPAQREILNQELDKIIATEKVVRSKNHQRN